MTSDTALFVRKIQVRIDDEVIELNRQLETIPTYEDSHKSIRGKVMGLEEANSIINRLVEEFKVWEEVEKNDKDIAGKNNL